jgi:transcriptional regulator with XRE-family HTH domain
MKDRDKKFIADFGKRIQILRKQNGLTQEDLSAKTDIPRAQIGRIERGEVNTTIKTMLRLARAFNVDIVKLVDINDRCK